MNLDIVFHQGDPSKPLVIFIHGMGMDANVWADPSIARVLGGKYPLSILLGDIELRNSFHDLSMLGFPVLTWSQQRPADESESAFNELLEIAETHAGTDKELILIGHSRGGLLARKLTDEGRFNIKTVITMATPHSGSTIAKWADRISPITSGIKSILDRVRENRSRSTFQRVTSFLSGSGIREMLPDSYFIRSLNPNSAAGIKTISIGGTDPSLLKIGGTPLGIILSRIIPEKILPDELRAGMGDGFVSARSSVYPNGHEHKNFHAHHAGIIFNIEAREYIKKIVNESIDG